MTPDQNTVARACLEAADKNTMSFPEIVGALMEAGFEGYGVDFRRADATYYLADGEALVLPVMLAEGGVAAGFDAGRIESAIREAQQLVAGYTYAGFCRKVIAAGCAGYMVSFSGRRAVYYGRTAETHVEHFPD